MLGLKADREAAEREARRGPGGPLARLARLAGAEPSSPHRLPDFLLPPAREAALFEGEAVRCACAEGHLDFDCLDKWFGALLQSSGARAEGRAEGGFDGFSFSGGGEAGSGRGTPTLAPGWAPGRHRRGGSGGERGADGDGRLAWGDEEMGRDCTPAEGEAPSLRKVPSRTRLLW